MSKPADKPADEDATAAAMRAFLERKKAERAGGGLPKPGEIVERKDKPRVKPKMRRRP
jgi:hypothetical protein